MKLMVAAKKLVIALVAMMALQVAVAQDYRYEAGLSLGMSGYLGDLNKGNMFRHPGFEAGAVFRYIADSRWAIKAMLATAGISGNSDGIVFPGGEKYSFSAQLYDLGAQVEFNFLNFGMGSKYLKLKRCSPYLVLGLGATLSHHANGNSATLNLPMGVGVKYKITERLNVGAEFTMRKSFSDNLDGMRDVIGIESGFAKNTDWYSFMMFTVTYEFSKRCRTCHYDDGSNRKIRDKKKKPIY